MGQSNHWTNLFIDRREKAAAISDAEALEYIRGDNYSPLREALRALEQKAYPGYRLDLDLSKGFDEEGFSRDGSGWRAIRYKPFLGTFWPTNGSTDDVFIRLPAAFRQDASGAESPAVYKLNLSLVEVALTLDPSVRDNAKRRRQVEPLDERVGGVDLNGDGQLTDGVTEVRGIPSHYVGGAAKVELRGHLYPAGTEFLPVGPDGLPLPDAVMWMEPDHPNRPPKMPPQVIAAQQLANGPRY
jgi:hypothetical protein